LSESHALSSVSVNQERKRLALIAAERSLSELTKYFDAIIPDGYTRSEVSRAYIEHHAAQIKFVLEARRRELFAPEYSSQSIPSHART
jgi:hypothetical protein